MELAMRVISDFCDFLAKVPLNVWDEEEEIEQKDEGEA
jgi:hypothetical protein